MYIRKSNLKHCLIIIFLSSIILSCNDDRVESHFRQVNDLIGKSPKEAVALLDTMNTTHFNEDERFYYDLLRIKAEDKAYIKHTEDSAILKIIKYYSSGQKHYPEALYYGGRVYSDLGMYPKALEFFNKALDEMPESFSNLELKSNTLSQKGRLLDRLRIYTDASESVKESLEIKKIQNDSSGIFFELQLLGLIYMHSEEYDSAEMNIQKAIDMSSSIRGVRKADPEISLAAVKYGKGEIESALNIVRGLPDSVNPNCRDFALTCAARIYLKAGIPDTAYRYVKELIGYKESPNRKNGYQMLLSPALRSYIPSDSLMNYLDEYYNVMEEYYNRHDAEQEMIQLSYYNYQVSEREYQKAEKEKESTYSKLIFTSVAILFLITVILFLINRNHKKEIRLHRILDRLKILEARIQEVNNNNLIDACPDSSNFEGIEDNEAQEITDSAYNDEKIIEKRNDLKDQIRLQLEKIKDSSNMSAPTLEIINTDSFMKLQQYLGDGKTLSDKNELWDELEKTVCNVSPEFKMRLQMLLGRGLKQDEFRMALLIKYGFTPAQISVLMNKHKSTISYRRKNMKGIIFDKNLEEFDIDDIIQIL